MSCQHYGEIAFLGDTLLGIERFPEKAVLIVRGVKQTFMASLQNRILFQTVQIHKLVQFMFYDMTQCENGP